MTPGAAQIVLTGGTFSFDIPANSRVLITKLCFGINTVSDDCTFTLGSTDQPGGLGNFTGRTIPFFVRTGATPSGRQTFTHDFYPPIPFVRSATVRSVTYQVDANDAACQIVCGWFGWFEAVA